MTKETFIKTIKNILASVSGIHWNSDTNSKLAALGRSFEAKKITGEEVLKSLQSIFPLTSFDDVEKALLKALR